MEKKTEKFSVQEAMRLAQSDAGQQLFSLLQQTDAGKLQLAMDQAAAGNYESIKATLSSLLSSDEAKKLMKQMEDQNGQHGR